jgi:hypothetical protein
MSLENQQMCTKGKQRQNTAALMPFKPGTKMPLLPKTTGQPIPSHSQFLTKTKSGLCQLGYTIIKRALIVFWLLKLVLRLPTGCLACYLT